MPYPKDRAKGKLGHVPQTHVRQFKVAVFIIGNLMEDGQIHCGIITQWDMI